MNSESIEKELKSIKFLVMTVLILLLVSFTIEESRWATEFWVLGFNLGLTAMCMGFLAAMINSMPDKLGMRTPGVQRIIRFSSGLLVWVGFVVLIVSAMAGMFTGFM